MTEQHPHVEVLSHNRVNRSQIFIAPVTIFSLAFAGIFVYAIWRFLLIIAYCSLALLLIGFLYLVAIMAINVYSRLLHARFIYNREHGMVDAVTGRVYPLSLPGPVTVTEERQLSEVDKLLVHRSKVLTAYFDQGKGMHAIEKELGIPYNQVRDWCNAALALRAKQQAGN